MTKHINIVFLCVGYCAANIAGNAPSRSPACEMSMTAPETRVQLGMPVDVIVLCTNKNAVPVSMKVLLEPQFGDVGVSIAGEGGSFRRYEFPTNGTIDLRAAATEIAPGESVSSALTILWNDATDANGADGDGELAFQVAGVYSIVVRVLIESEEIVLPSLKLEVVEPVGEDVKVWEEIRRNNALARVLHTRDPEGAKQLAPLIGKVLAESPSTTYRPGFEAVLSAANGAQ
jgi:hypothetical protein